MDDWQSAKARRVVIIRWVFGLVLCIATGIGYAQHRASMERYQISADTREYNAAMKSLRSHDPQNLNKAEQAFHRLAARGDVRGNFGLACVMHHRDPYARQDAIEILRPAANAGFLPAQAALLARYATFSEAHQFEKDQDAAQQLLFQLLLAAEKGAFSQSSDSSLPADGKIKIDTPLYVWKILGEGLCAPRLQDDEIERVMKKSAPFITLPVLRIPDP